MGIYVDDQNFSIRASTNLTEGQVVRVVTATDAYGRTVPAIAAITAADQPSIGWVRCDVDSGDQAEVVLKYPSTARFTTGTATAISVAGGVTVRANGTIEGTSTQTNIQAYALEPSTATGQTIHCVLASAGLN